MVGRFQTFLKLDKDLCLENLLLYFFMTYFFLSVKSDQGPACDVVVKAAGSYIADCEV